MKKLMVVSCALVLLAAGRSSAQDTHEALLKEMIGNLKEATSLLKGVKDEETANAAGPKVKKIAESMKETAKKLEKLGKPTKEQEAELEKKYKEDLSKLLKDFQTELLRVKDVKGGLELLKAFQDAKP
jgi:cytochrome c556